MADNGRAVANARDFYNNVYGAESFTEKEKEDMLRYFRMMLDQMHERIENLRDENLRLRRQGAIAASANLAPAAAKCCVGLFAETSAPSHPWLQNL